MLTLVVSLFFFVWKLHKVCEAAAPTGLRRPSINTAVVPCFRLRHRPAAFDCLVSTLSVDGFAGRYA